MKKPSEEDARCLKQPRPSRQKTQEESEVIPPKPPRTPEEEAAHLLKKAEKKNKKAEKRKKHRLSLIAITLSVFLAWLGSTVFVMFHAILASDLGATHSRVKIALASYSVALIMIAVAGGRMADILGRKRMFMIGGLAFSVAALLGLTVATLGRWLRFARSWASVPDWSSPPPAGPSVDHARFDTP